jgi:hypothetical protein
VSKKPSVLPPKLQAWVDARRRHRLSHAHVQMARELGLNPRKLGKLDNHGQEPWKQPLPQFIERLYGKRFGRERPEVVTPIEEQARQLVQAKAGRRTRPGGARTNDGDPRGEGVRVQAVLQRRFRAERSPGSGPADPGTRTAGDP